MHGANWDLCNSLSFFFSSLKNQKVWAPLEWVGGDLENSMDKFSSSYKFRKWQPGAVHTIHKICSSLLEREDSCDSFSPPQNKSTQPSEHRLWDSNSRQFLLPQAWLPDLGWSWAKSLLSVAPSEGPSMCLGMLVPAEWEPMEGFCGHTGKTCYEADWQIDILSLALSSVIGCFWLGLECIFDLQVILNHQVEQLRSVKINCWTVSWNVWECKPAGSSSSKSLTFLPCDMEHFVIMLKLGVKADTYCGRYLLFVISNSSYSGNSTLIFLWRTKGAVNS